jgi:hypothetical protein
MAAASAADAEHMIRAAANVDWLAIAHAIASGFADKNADEAAEKSLEELASELAPIIAPYLTAAVGASLVPVLGLAPLLVPAITLAVAEFKGGDPDPEIDANAYSGCGGRGN